MIKLLIQYKIDQELFFESLGNLCPTYLSYHVFMLILGEIPTKTFQNFNVTTIKINTREKHTQPRMQEYY